MNHRLRWIALAAALALAGTIFLAYVAGIPQSGRIIAGPCSFLLPGWHIGFFVLPFAMMIMCMFVLRGAMCCRRP